VIDARSFECSRLELWLQLSQQSGRCNSVALARIGAKELALVVVKVDEIEVDAPVAQRRNLGQSAAMREGRFES
jgi:hypothetical protein